MKKLFLILAIMATAATAWADGDYYDYSSPVNITIGGDGTVIFGDGNVMNPIEIDESAGDEVKIDPDAEIQSVGLVRVDDIPLYLMITNKTKQTQTFLLGIGNQTWLYSINQNGVILSAKDIMDYGPAKNVRVTAAPGAVLLERVQP